MKTSTKIIILILILLAIASGFYWYIFFYGPGNEVEPVATNNGSIGGFVPLSTPLSTPVPSPTETSTSTDNGNATATTTPIVVAEVVPSLRLVSSSPIGGYGASTTASTTVVRWVDRGRGNVFETKSNTNEVVTLSNTILPRTYESVWNKNLTAFIGSLLSNNSETPTVVYAKLNIQASPSPTPKATPIATTTSTSTITVTATPQANLTPYSLKGKNLPDNMLGYAVSPKGDKIFMFIKENNQGVGYVANFDGTSVSKIFITPVTEVNVEWPEENTVAITTKGSANHGGFLYFLNTKTGVWKKILGPIYGLSTKVSKDAKYIFTSATGSNQSLVASIYAVGTSTPIESTIATLADKCVWGNFHKEFVYCATPSLRTPASYPDDWYKGTVSFTDKIWQLNVKTGEITLVTPIIDQSDRLIDAFNLGLDQKDEFLFFMNKRDLSLWSFDLSSI